MSFEQQQNQSPAVPTDTWADVVNSPEWGDFDEKQKQQIRENFYSSVVVPSAQRKSGDSTPDWNAVRAEFDHYTAPFIQPRSSGFLNNIATGAERGAARAVRGLSIAAAGAAPFLPGMNPATAAEAQGQAFNAAQNLQNWESSLPAPRTTGEKIAQGAGGFIPGLLSAGSGEAGAAGADVLDRGGSLLQAEGGAGIATATNLAALATGRLGTGLPARVALQGAAGAVLSEGARRAENALLPDNMRRDFDAVDLGLSVGAAAAGAALPHGGEQLGHGADLIGDGAAAGKMRPGRVTTGDATPAASPPTIDADTAHAQLLDALSRLPYGTDEDAQASLRTPAPGVDASQPNAAANTRAQPAALPEGVTIEPHPTDDASVLVLGADGPTGTAARALGARTSFNAGGKAQLVMPSDAEPVLRASLEARRIVGKPEPYRGVLDDSDPLLPHAEELANQLGEGAKVSPDAIGSLGARGDARINNILGQLEERGVLSEPDESGVRRVLPRDEDPAAARAPTDDPGNTSASESVDNEPAPYKAGASIPLPKSVQDAAHDLLMKTAPMATGSPEAQAAAKDFANSLRLARYEGDRADFDLRTRFTREQQERMWTAADAESVAQQTGKPTTAGLDSLHPLERQAVLREQTNALDAWNQAKALGMVSGDALPSYVPRMIVEMTDAGAKRAGRGVETIGNAGRNLKTTTAQLQGRKYVTTEGTESAARARFGDNTQVVKNIRTLPLATARLREAIAGRSLVNKIRDLGTATHENTVVEGAPPAGQDSQYFTIQHPAFRVFDPHTGRQQQLYVRKDFEGPLRAVLTEKEGALYRALMQLKAKTMSVVMYSPIIHNAVEFGRALPAMPGKVASLRVYFDGARAKADPTTMREAINAGMVPIGSHGAMSDITGIASEPHIEPGRSITAHLLAMVPGAINKRAGDAVLRAVDKAGDVWHNTLLWDRVGDLQAGLYVGLRDNLVSKGADAQTAQRIAAHFANRYAGALPREAMSEGARKLANLTLFSRSFTLGNLGAMKDALTGLPRDVQAQILRDAGKLAQTSAVSIARKKALATLVLDIGLMYVGNSLLQSSAAMLSGDRTLDQEAQGYARRLNQALQRTKENPLSLLNPFEAVNQLTPMHDNEPGKQDRVLVGHAADGTAIYMRNPVGKIGEEFQGWIISPLDMVRRKLGTLARPAWQVLSNDQGFGRKVYNPNANTPAEWADNAGKIVQLFMQDQLPMQSITAARDYLAGKGDATINALQALGPFGGVTFSKGAPGGEAVGEMYHAREQHDFRMQQEMPAVRDAIRAGDLRTAAAMMSGLGIAPNLQAYYVRTTLHPSTRLSPKQLQQFFSTASPEEAERMRAMLSAQHGR